MARQVKVEIVGDSRDLERAFARSSKAGKQFQANITGVGRSLTSLAGFGGATAAVAGLGVAFKVAFDEMRESRKVAAQTAAVLKSTGQVAGVTAEHVSELADAMLRKTGIDDEAIAFGENLLLTFTNIRNVVGRGNDVFDQATRTMLDMSVALGQDTKDSAIQLGKALNDPVKGVTALTRVGVSFTQQQQGQIRTLSRSGRVLDAQKIILRELAREFGGSAEAAGKADGGLSRLRETAVNFAGELAEKFLPQIENTTTELQKWLDDPRNIEQAEKKVSKFAEVVGGVAAGLYEANRRGDEFMEGLRRNMTRITEGGRAGWLGALERISPSPVISDWAKREREESLKELRALAIEASAAAVDIGAALKIRDRPLPSEMFPPVEAGARAPGGVGAGGAGGASASQRNKWFDAMIGRRRDRVQDVSSLTGQITALREIARLIRERIAVTKDITRQQTLEDELVAVRRQIRGTQEEIREQTAELREERKALEEQRREREALARQTRQFRELGLGPGGAALVPGVQALRKRFGRLEDAIKGTFLDTDRARSVMQNIRKLLSGELGKLDAEVRAKLEEMLAGYTKTLDEHAKRPRTHRIADVDDMIGGLGLTRAQSRILSGRLASVGRGGTVPLGGPGAFGMRLTPRMDVHVALELDGDKLGTATLKDLQRKARRTSPQQRGVRPGSALGLN